ncbi:MAG: hypothetical protein A2430_00015 [Candidatus Liptonbacteria bacterium RIFOXYC1_FULL_36_8]|uniref:Uncharacterized protein n=2 Tax=Candidatus Liptoniibacteriota TaxID=1817909 RepID=A0A1G2CSA8_9BACT|nr:MAG: hypothetical protein A2430_00015 [Candidatus Liptonbacteria bacterium RIFOXYC1_FULL_36_8]OGZ04464.1 MAG: hypothetical protein A2604_02410 [Candidatus Liptonbacteria bacterium RIFOXYD1_FULL_36_11]
MTKKEFILILAVLIIISGTYYLYNNKIWPFSNVESSLSSTPVYAISGVAKEVYDTVLVLQTIDSENSRFGELTAVINDDTQVFKYADSSGSEIITIPLKVSDIKIGDRIAITSNDDIATKDNKVFLASSIAVYK